MGELVKKNNNRGVFAIEQWKDLRKSGGIAPSIAEIENVLQGDNKKMYSREEVIIRISNYFQSCITDTVDEETGEVVRVWCRNPTKAGLALSLGLSSQTLADYVSGIRSDGVAFSKNENSRRIVSNEDFDILRKAYSLIEMFYEEKLGENRNNAGVIFWLNNLQNNRWSNEQSFKFDYRPQVEERRCLTTDELPQLSGSAKTDNVTLSMLPQFNKQDD